MQQKIVLSFADGVVGRRVERAKGVWGKRRNRGAEAENPKTGAVVRTNYLLRLALV